MNESPLPAQHPASASESRTGQAPAITVYWRPGCPFCGMLFRKLERDDVAHTRVNIWEDPDAAAVVRSIARGNETVPTVVVRPADGTDPVGLVNPSVDEILAAAGTR